MRKRTRDSSEPETIAKRNEMRMNLRKRDSRKENKTKVEFDINFSDKNSRSTRTRVNYSETNVKCSNVESASIENENIANRNTRPTRACKKQTSKDQYCNEHLDKVPLKLHPSKAYSTRRNKVSYFLQDVIILVIETPRISLIVIIFIFSRKQILLNLKQLQKLRNQEKEQNKFLLRSQK